MASVAPHLRLQIAVLERVLEAKDTLSWVCIRIPQLLGQDKVTQT